MKTAALFLSLSAILYTTDSIAQHGGPAVEQWKSFLPYNQAVGVASDGTNFFCATNSGFFTYNRTDGTLTPYSKSNGMSDIGLSGVAYDPLTNQAVLAYTNSNIDLFKDNTFYNIPEIKRTNVGGDKTIHHVTASEGRAYLSSTIGLVILNLNKKEVKETVVFSDNGLTVPVYASVVANDSVFAVTGMGLFRTSVNNNFILNYATWDELDPRVFHYIGYAASTLYTAEADSLYERQNGTINFFRKTQYPVTSLDAGDNGIWVSASSPDLFKGYGKLVKSDGTVSDSFSSVSPTQVVPLANNEVWFTDNSNFSFPTQHGLRKKTSVDKSDPFYPDGPIVASSFDISAYNGDLWMAHGGKTEGWGFTKNRAMYSHFTNDKWINFPYFSYEWVQDFIRVLRDQRTGRVYLGSYSGGVVIVEPSGETNVYNKNVLPSVNSEGVIFPVSGLALDENDNLWINNGGTPYELSVKTSDGNWYNCKSIIENTEHSAADVLVDDYGQKWFITNYSRGAVVYNDNGTPENSSDDQYRMIRAGAGSGNLPDNNTLSIVKDKDGVIWIGTSNGIGIVSEPDGVISGKSEATLKVVTFGDQIGGYLFQNQAVKTMAVDGANRKWIGTTNGVWLISEDAESIIYRFTEDNSPLPSNFIERINIDPVTGDVYFSTSKGVVAFRSTATDGKPENDKPLVIYPNPVPSGFNGMIAVKGVAENADVRFTDIAGQMVYRTKALGGQAVWNGKDYTGRRVQSGVYLVFVVNKDGTQKATGKFIFHN